jgi:hypothetical protein
MEPEMKKMQNPYKEASIFELNMMHVRDMRRLKFSAAEVMLTVLPIVAIVVIFAATVMPELKFFADCKNVMDGDVCSITLG